MIYGTSHFYSLSAAVAYYRPYGFDAFQVEQKVSAGEIHIGKPELGPGERLSLIDGGKRYAITEAPKP